MVHCPLAFLFSLVLLVIQSALMILLEGFLVRLMIGITKNPSRRITKSTRLNDKKFYVLKFDEPKEF